MNNEIDQWQQHLGAVWASLLSNHSLDHSGIIIEIGPGFTDKIGCVLAKLQFRGVFYILEPNKLALKWVMQRYQTLLPDATIVAVNGATKNGCTVLPCGVEAILMNHVLDDMLLYAGLRPDTQQSIFSQIRPGNPCHFQVKNTWQTMLDDPDYLSKLKEEVLADLSSLIAHADARLVGMSQYKSWFLFQNGLEKADSMGNSLLWDIASHLGETSIEDKDILRSYGQRPQDWLFVEKEGGFKISDNKSSFTPAATERKVW